ncbi:MAG: enoyl-CoA hydratase/isomerase family protein [Gammaproteobacteria bacterium]|nr:enoyl-CoA hydratase/isomerase family protein [Gammaproteobacteria bacterium]
MSTCERQRAIDRLDARRLTLGEASGVRDWYRLQHWRLGVDAQGLGWLELDRQQERVNSLSLAVVEELDQMLDQLDQTGPARPRALVIRSAKTVGFMVGADVHELADVGSEQSAMAHLHRAHQVIDRLAGLPLPTVVVVHGHCLGGGLELALACSNRLALDDARFGFPEVRLGLHPGLGGTRRLPRTVAPLEGLRMMLDGRTIDARRARAIGLVQEVVQERHVHCAVTRIAQRSGPAPHRGWRRTITERLFAFQWPRTIAARLVRRKLRARIDERHYPAPFALLELWREHAGNARHMQRAEIESFAGLLNSATARNLLRVFRLREQLRGAPATEQRIEHVHVIGAGTMGGDIAAWCALKGLRVTLSDQDAEAIGRACARAAKLFDSRLDHRSARAARDRLVPDFAGSGARHADVLIEAVAEDTAVKQQVLCAVEPCLRSDALLATNSSSIPLAAIGERLAEPHRLVGLHFFNPVARLPLVELVLGTDSRPEQLTRARAFCARIDRLPVVVRSSPGFLVNRVLAPYLMEALLALDEGFPAQSIDAAAERFGMPMGPLELADRVGLDICLDVARKLRGADVGGLPAPSARLEALVESGALGQKTGQGLYRWRDAEPVKENTSDEPDEAFTDRLILPLVNACVACLREGICASADEIDAALIFATGFAPFRGGPLQHARDLGTATVVQRLEHLMAQHGDRFRPDAGWASLTQER